MVEGFRSPAESTYWLIQGRILFLVIHLLGLACFSYIAAKRLRPLLRGQADFRFDRPVQRLGKVFQFWLAQWRHPRYPAAGIIHILVFAGFLLLATRAFSLILGFSDNFFGATVVGHIYEMVREYATTIVFACMVVLAIRRLVFKPARYAVPAKYGKSHTGDAILLLALIAILMLADSVFEASKAAAQARQGQPAEFLAFLSLPWILEGALGAAPLATLQKLYLGGYLAHDLTFFFLLCYRPFGIQFHVETSLFNIYFAKLDRATLKPVRWGVSDQQLDELKSFGVKTFDDFTWKHMLDFYSCADCGRCSDNCPANAVGRPLSPRFLTIKARDYCFAALSGVGQVGKWNRVDRRHLFGRRDLVLHDLRRMRAGMSAAGRIHR